MENNSNWICPTCGAANTSGKFCVNCGSAMPEAAAPVQAEPVQAEPVQPVQEAQPVYAQPVYSEPVYAQPAAQTTSFKTGMGLAIASLACGVMSICLSYCYGFGIPFGIAGLILSGKAVAAGHPSKMPLAGKITSIVGIVLGAVLLFIILMGVIAGVVSDR
ncbi:MAG: hypothetical protein J6X33_06005 [Clostridiales bacterium]|nr:hypothetical protein [Clostridiales bacterium]